jgi:hypothetical protein
MLFPVSAIICVQLVVYQILNSSIMSSLPYYLIVCCLQFSNYVFVLLNTVFLKVINNCISTAQYFALNFCSVTVIDEKL